MEAGADLKQAAYAAIKLNPSRRGFCNAGKHFEQGRFASAISAYDAKNLTRHDLEAHVTQRPHIALVGDRCFTYHARALCAMEPPQPA